MHALFWSLDELQVQYTSEKALDHPLDSAINRFGYDARGVSEAVFDYRRGWKKDN